jgi:hypothetical protein
LRSLASVAAGLAVVVAAKVASAEPDPAPPPKPAPYVNPWQLRGVTASTSLRSDTAMAFYEDAASRHGLTFASLLTATLRIPHTGPKSAGLTAFLRGAFAEDKAPAGGSGLALANPALGAAYALRLPSGFRTSFTLAATLPLGNGGGNNPSPKPLQARRAAPQARSQLDGSLYSPNDFTVSPGVDFAWVGHGITLQLEATLFQLERVRGELKQPEASKTNTTYGFFAGYFLVPLLSLGAELRYQRWLNPPFSVETAPATWDTLSFAVGPRFHIRLPGDMWIRPGIAYARGLDKPMAAATPNLHIVQLDVPFFF